MDLSKRNVLARVGRMEQLAAIKRYAFEDGKGRGMRAFEVVNGSGFDFTVYPDRGLDIGPARRRFGVVVIRLVIEHDRIAFCVGKQRIDRQPIRHGAILTP